MGSKTKTVNKPETLTPEGRKQFDFAARKLEQQFNKATPFASFSRSGINDSISKLNRFDASFQTDKTLDRLERFQGSGDAFRTLSSLEQFGQGEQGFVTQARSDLLNFDDGFSSDALPLLLQSARGDFLTQDAGNPFIQNQIDIAQRGAIDNFNEQVLPNLLASFSGTGGVGSSLQAGFANQQARDLQRTLGDISTGVSFNVFEAERERQLQAQNAILGFESTGLDRALAARQTNLQSAQTSAQQLLDARVAAGGQATQLSQQQLDALQAAAGSRTQIDLARQQALQGALQGQLGKEQLAFDTQQLNAQLVNDRINQLIAAQQAAGTGNAGKDVQETLRRSV